MIELLVDQVDSDRLFRRWADAMIDGSTAFDTGWVIEGTGVAFGNYGHGQPGVIEDQVMLGVDASLASGVVKIVRPDVQRQDKGKLTAIGVDENGCPLLLRQGWLKKNRISDEVRTDFARLTDLPPVAVMASGQRSERDWYVVANLSATNEAILNATASFANACARGRFMTGGGMSNSPDSDHFTLGLDEKGHVRKVKVAAGTKEVLALQGYVWEELNRLTGGLLTKPSKYGYAVDAVIDGAKFLIEIKTGVSADDIYTAVGQPTLYRSLIGLPDDLRSILLIPSTPQLRPQMAAALDSAGIEVHLFSVGKEGAKPEVAFAPKFIERCKRSA